MQIIRMNSHRIPHLIGDLNLVSSVFPSMHETVEMRSSSLLGLQPCYSPALQLHDVLRNQRLQGKAILL